MFVTPWQTSARSEETWDGHRAVSANSGETPIPRAWQPDGRHEHWRNVLPRPRRRQSGGRQLQQVPDSRVRDDGRVVDANTGETIYRSGAETPATGRAFRTGHQPLPRPLSIARSRGVEFRSNPGLARRPPSLPGSRGRPAEERGHRLLRRSRSATPFHHSGYPRPQAARVHLERAGGAGGDGAHRRAEAVLEGLWVEGQVLQEGQLRTA